MPSDLAGFRRALEGHIQDGWDLGAYPIQWPGQAWTEENKPSGTWIRVTILWGDGFPETMGDEEGAGALNMLPGVLSIGIFTTPGSGMGDVYTVADLLRSKLNRVEVNGVRFEVPSGVKPADPEPEWLQSILDVPFYVLETV